MCREPSGFVSGALHSSQLNHTVMDKEGAAVVAILNKLDYLMSTESRFLVTIKLLPTFLTLKRVPVTRTPTQRLPNWRIFLSQYPIEIVHIAGGRHCWGDLLWRW